VILIPASRLYFPFILLKYLAETLGNATRGRELLAANNIPLIAEHVGGNGRRKLHFDLHSGHVWLAFPEGSNAYIRNSHE
jgi:hypothetical protein